MSAGMDTMMFRSNLPPSVSPNTAPTKKSPKTDTPSSVTTTEASSSPHSLDPAIDGPPSPERIRAYTEQMKRSSIFGNNSRSNTLSSSSASSSFVSRDLTSASSDGLTLSRKSSGRSTTGSMPPRTERPESTQLFGSIFSRGGRKSRRNNSSASLAVGGGILEEGSARNHYYGKGHSARKGASVSSVTLGQESQRRQLISGPYNFQHVTHTAQEQLPNLERSSRLELVSEFSALRASQAPTKGELKGIRAQDLHFENFSSEALSPPLSEGESQTPPPIPQRHRGVLRRSVQAPRSQRSMSYTIPHDRLGSAPPRPPRSPLSPICPIEPPIRTSSRASTARVSSVLFDTFDPLAKPNVERTHRMATGFRHPAPFAPPRPSPAPPLFDQPQNDNVPNGLASHALTTPGNEAWPLTASPSGNFVFELADVKEEEEVGSRRSRISATNSELRLSQSVPSLRRSYDAHSSENRVSVILSLPPIQGKDAQGKPPLSPGFRFDDDSWEKDIDYCYEHEIEADCDYQWDRRSAMEDQNQSRDMESAVAETQLELPVEGDDCLIYQGRFRPSLLIPSAYDVPELSPMSNNSVASPDPRTPQIHLSRPSHGRSSSRASSFKESHGFTLSPTLLIPSDFQSQMEQDAAYDDHFSNNQSISGTIFEQVPYNACISPVDESSSSIVSYRSSNLSHGSTHSSSGTHISGTNSRGSQDSMVLLGRAAGIDQAHQSIGSASSLPDLIPSVARKPESSTENDDAVTPAALSPVEDSLMEDSSTPTPPLRNKHNKSPVLDHKARKGVNYFTPPPLPIATEVANEDGMLSSVAESFPSLPQEQVVGGQAHGRKVSAPVLSQSVKEFKTRPRAGTSASGVNMAGGKKRGSYMLFPQI